MLAYEEFQRLSELEDAMWLQRAWEAAAGGYRSVEESEDFMKKRLSPATEK